MWRKEEGETVRGVPCHGVLGGMPAGRGSPLQRGGETRAQLAHIPPCAPSLHRPASSAGILWNRSFHSHLRNEETEAWSQQCG